MGRVPGAAIGPLELADLTPGYLLSLLRSWLLDDTRKFGGLKSQDRSKCATPRLTRRWLPLPTSRRRISQTDVRECRCNILILRDYTQFRVKREALIETASAFDRIPGSAGCSTAAAGSSTRECPNSRTFRVSHLLVSATGWLSRPAAKAC